MNKVTVFLILVFLQGCAQKPYYGDLTYLGKLPSKLNEVSGIASVNDSIAWVIEDNGNKDHIYAINLKGNLVKKLKVENAKNHDWEDLAKDEKGNLYIGNFGNNANERKNLSIYKLPNPDNQTGNKIKAEKITFEYPQQEKFPPKKSKLMFDCEAFFYKDNFLYLITKNRTRPYTGKALIYKVPAVIGSHQATLIGEFTACKDPQFCSITGADISPDGKKVVLLGSGFIWLFTDFSSDDFTKGSLRTIDVKHRTQQESICFVDNRTLLIADEQSKTKGRNLYSYLID
ncbi:hypothetical protein DKG77_05380 [Flagellimonas aquimarina]|uniref:SdiA-regulated n=1 Tax=Flagellimonas aquimarina TaxID=2201895 RepID=A0A316L2I1_9FLAO|nr:hypothetical protein [Allomuricauda koreensis]PWL40254.1 hypothetical protein DKG77_05380 [Allomuricauda koreensis]